MGNTCTSHRGVETKVSRSTSRVSSPPWAPRNSDEERVEPYGSTSVMEPAAQNHSFGVTRLRLISVNQVAMYPDIDEGGSPAVDVTKSLESIHAWLQDLSDSDASTDGNLSPDADFTSRSEEHVSLPATFDAEEERQAGRIVRAAALKTPLVTRHHKHSFF